MSRLLSINPPPVEPVFPGDRRSKEIETFFFCFQIVLFSSFFNYAVKRLKHHANDRVYFAKQILGNDSIA